MRLCQYYTSAEQRDVDLSRRSPWEARVGLVVHEALVPVTHCIDPNDTSLGLPLATRVIEWLESRSAWAKLEDWAGRNPTGSIRVRDVYLGPPLLRPPAFLDFNSDANHAQAMQEVMGVSVPDECYANPLYYNGNPTAFFGHGQRVPFPRGEDRMDFELEIACVLGRRVRNVSAEEGKHSIIGYSILNDWSCRTGQVRGMKTGMGPSGGKDHATSLGPYLVSTDEVPDIKELGMRAYVNDELWCETDSSASRWSIGEMVAAASSCRTLYPGSVLALGAVSGGSGLAQGRFLKNGDRVRLEVDRLGSLENTIYVE